jgi:hypothetical protein
MLAGFQAEGVVRRAAVGVLIFPYKSSLEGDHPMNKFIAIAALALLVGITAGNAAPQESKGKTCRMEQQCHWENFKKVCTYVKVCR